MHQSTSLSCNIIHNLKIAVNSEVLQPIAPFGCILCATMLDKSAPRGYNGDKIKYRGADALMHNAPAEIAYAAEPFDLIRIIPA